MKNLQVNLTSDERFKRAAQDFCKDEMAQNQAMGKCASQDKPGYLLSCLLESINLLNKESRCFKFLCTFRLNIMITLIFAYCMLKSPIPVVDFGLIARSTVINHPMPKLTIRFIVEHKN